MVTFQKSPKKANHAVSQIENKQMLVNACFTVAVLSGGLIVEQKGQHLDHGRYHIENAIGILQLEKETASMKPKTMTKKWYQKSIDKQIIYS